MAKYIIDVPNQDYSYDKVLHTLKLKFYDDNLSCEIFFDAEPYTEPDRESIEDEVWGFVRIITDMTECERKECFGCSTCDLDEYMTYKDAKTKYEAWVKQKNEIRVGDEVKLSEGVKGLVYIVGEEMLKGAYLNCDGLVPFCWRKKDCRKTGKHFDEMAELLKEMGDTE